jgi:hypothetical protein
LGEKIFDPIRAAQLNVGHERQRRGTAQRCLPANRTLQSFSVFLEDIHEGSFLVLVTESRSETHDRTVKTSVGLHVRDAYPLQAIIVYAIQLVSNDLAQEFVEPRTALRALITAAALYMPSTRAHRLV